MADFVSPVEHVRRGLEQQQTRAARKHQLELLQRAPKDLNGLLALCKASETKHARIKERSLSFQTVATEAKRAARAEAKRLGISDVRMHEYVKQHVDAAIQKWRDQNDKDTKGQPGGSARLHAEVLEMYALAASIIPRYNSAVGLLALSTSSGADAAARREHGALLVNAGPSALRNALALAIQEGSRSRLSAVVDAANAIPDRDQRRQLMAEIEDAADLLCGTEMRAARAAIASMEADANGATFYAAPILGHETSSLDLLTVGHLRKRALRMVDEVGGDDPKEPEQQPEQQPQQE